ncbi:MAG: right-handed parallel beta-helix repeat-containing protein [bacterium]
MKKYFLLLGYLLMVLSSLLAQEIHVSINGNDHHEGSATHPLATLEAARDLARTYKDHNNVEKSGLKIIIHGGQYNLRSSLQFDERDGGSHDAPVIWKAADGEQVRITGGKDISLSSFKPVKDKKILKRLPENARGSVLEINLKKNGINHFGQHRQYGHGLPVMPAPLEVFFRNEPMILARYPNKGTMKIGKVIDPGSVPRNGDKSNRGPVFTYTDERHARWTGRHDVWIQGTLNYGFADDYTQIESIDTINKQVKLLKPHLYGVASGADFQSYTAHNILEELDSPGEWYADHKDGILYFWPPSRNTNDMVQVSILEEPIICMEGVKNFRFEGMIIEAGRGMGMYMEACRNTIIAGCTIRNLGTCGILMGMGAKATDEQSSIDDYEGMPASRQIGSLQNHFYINNAWNRNAGEDNGIVSCDIYNTGSGGVFLSGGDKKTLKPGNSYLENCKIHDYNRRNKFNWAGVIVDGVGNRVSHCEVYNSDWQGIYVHGNEHLFEFNHIHDVTLNSNDTSPWYIGRNPSDRGNVLQYNYFSNCGNPDRMNMGIYCDDSSTDVYVFGNIFNNMKTNHGVLFANTGWDLVMKNNIIINPLSHSAVISAHYYTWAVNTGNSMFGKDGLLRKRLEKELDFRSPPYSTNYPTLLNYLDVIKENEEWEGMRSRGNIFSENVIVGSPVEPVLLMGGIHAQMTSENNWITKDDPGFNNMKEQNFLLREDSEVFKMIPGFKKIPFEKIGLYTDKFRKERSISLH